MLVLLRTYDFLYLMRSVLFSYLSTYLLASIDVDLTTAMHSTKALDRTVTRIDTTNDGRGVNMQ